MKNTEGLLILEDPMTKELIEFPGILFGATTNSQTFAKNPDQGYGEVVFNTSMTGYQEILTDPSYFGQIVCMTVPHIGNTGVNTEDYESKGPRCSGFVIHDLEDEPSNWRSKGALEDYLLKYGIPGIRNVDTRHLTRQLRIFGVARGIILPLSERSSAQKLLSTLPKFEGRDLIREVTTREPYKWPMDPKATGKKRRLVAIDFGVKWNLLNCLKERGCEIEVLPATATAEDVMSRKPDGVFLSNGPGDPSAATYAIKTVSEILGKVPIFGVCMGHQILGLAVGGKAYKLKFGHRGGNQPVFDKKKECVEISSHNHGYSIDARSLPKNVVVSHINLNDQTVEGLEIPDKQAFSVQYHPEASPGPQDSMELFDRFVRMMDNVPKIS